VPNPPGNGRKPVILPPPKNDKRPTKTDTNGQSAPHSIPGGKDKEFSGKIRRIDLTAKSLEVSLPKREVRHFTLSNDVKVMDNGLPSRLGLHNPKLKMGTKIVVTTGEDLGKVKAINILP